MAWLRLCIATIGLTFLIIFLCPAFSTAKIIRGYLGHYYPMDKELILSPMGKVGMKKFNRNDEHGFLCNYKIRGVEEEPWFKKFERNYTVVEVEVENIEKDGCRRKCRFVSWAGKTAEAIKAKKRTHEEARRKKAEIAARKAEELRKKEELRSEELREHEELRRKAALERAKEAERAAKESEERERKKQMELEAQPPRLLVCKVDHFDHAGKTLTVKIGDFTYRIIAAKNICVQKGETAKVVVRRVDFVKGNEFLCDFVSYDQEFLKEHNELVARNKKTSQKLKNQLLDKDKEIAKLRQKVNDQMKKLSKYENDITKFRLKGKITDRGKNYLQIWGLAYPIEGNKTHWATRVEDTTIIILNPPPLDNPVYYVGINYFREKRHGKNVFGASVPILVFGDMKREIKAKVEPTMQRYSKLRQELKQLKNDREEIADKLSRAVGICQ